MGKIITLCSVFELQKLKSKCQNLNDYELTSEVEKLIQSLEGVYKERIIWKRIPMLKDFVSQCSAILENLNSREDPNLFLQVLEYRKSAILVLETIFDADSVKELMEELYHYENEKEIKKQNYSQYIKEKHLIKNKKSIMDENMKERHEDFRGAYCSESVRENFRVIVSHGKFMLCHPIGTGLKEKLVIRPLNTYGNYETILSVDKKGNMFVAHNKRYANWDERMYHSSAVSGGKVFFAGTIETDQGVLSDN